MSANLHDNNATFLASRYFLFITTTSISNGWFGVFAEGEEDRCRRVLLFMGFQMCAPVVAAVRPVNSSFSAYEFYDKHMECRE
jgi:hypothetical protein